LSWRSPASWPNIIAIRADIRTPPTAENRDDHPVPTGFTRGRDLCRAVSCGSFGRTERDGSTELLAVQLFARMIGRFGPPAPLSRCGAAFSRTFTRRAPEACLNPK
jgi:hypothetical protein